jgi:lysozyme
MDFKKFLDLLVSYEKLELTAYLDQVGVWTIGIGTTVYPNGQHVKKGDKITKEQAYQYAEHEAKEKLAAIQPYIKVPLTDNQLMAVLCLVYNIGDGGFISSSVLKSINNEAPLQEIHDNWLKWNKGHVNGQLVELHGLTVRRESEFKLYANK